MTESPTGDRATAVALYNHVWDLLGTTGRTTAQDDDMVHAAHASRWHWGLVGGAEQRACGEWQCSRVYAVLGRSEPALHHARRCLEICESEPVPDWLAASAHEALARAYAVGGEAAAAREHASRAAALCAALADPDDRAVVEGDLASLPAGIIPS